MSAIEEALVSRMGAHAGVGAITDDFYPMVAPQGADPPYVVYQNISAPELEVAEYVRPRFQLTCWAASYSGAVALANAARACFYNQHLTVLGVHFRSWIANIMDGEQDAPTSRYSRIVDVRFDYQNPT
ncbi:MAG: DUF3168 domain-containing protein [bacterium]